MRFCLVQIRVNRRGWLWCCRSLCTQYPPQICFIAPLPYVSCPLAFTLIYAHKPECTDQLWLQLTNAPSNQSAAIKQHPIKFVWQADPFHHSGGPYGFLEPTCPEHCLRDGLELLIRQRRFCKSSVGHSRQSVTVKIPLDLVIKPCCFLMCQHSSVWSASPQTEKREEHFFCLFNRLSLEFAGTCCVQFNYSHTRWKAFFCNPDTSVLLWAVKTSCHVAEWIFVRWLLHRFEQQEVHFKEHVSAARRFSYSFVKRFHF